MNPQHGFLVRDPSRLADWHGRVDPGTNAGSLKPGLCEKEQTSQFGLAMGSGLAQDALEMVAVSRVIFRRSAISANDRPDAS